VAAASPFAPSDELAELHAHLGGSVPPHVLWEIAHLQGIALPTKDYWEFVDLTSISDPRGVDGLTGLDRIYHLTELIQSSPLAVERSVYGMVGGGYRSQRITTSEVRFNPMKRNRGGERDLDHTILAAIHALDIAELAYPQVHAGLILMMDRTFSSEQNAIIVDKAIRYAPRGVVGVDIAGPRPVPGRYPYRELEEHVRTARDAGLGVTIHVGEEGFADEIGEVVEHLRPDRIGHGILAAGDPELVRLLRDTGTVLEICPTSNLLTGALGDDEEVVRVFRTFLEGGVRVTVSTDGPEMMRTHLRDEFEFLCRIGALQPDEARAANVTAHEVRFGGPGRPSRRRGT
jgi:adenosine deaminase